MELLRGFFLLFFLEAAVSASSSWALLFLRARLASLPSLRLRLLLFLDDDDEEEDSSVTW
jgi:hypothetical protein